MMREDLVTVPRAPMKLSCRGYLRALTPPILACGPSMIREWENGCQKCGKQRAKDAKAREWKTAERRSDSRMSVRTPNTSDSFGDKTFPSCQGDRCSASPLGMWTKFYKSDPRIALGKYSPLEKEILRLGGVHTVASRKFLTYKKEEERKMLKELQLMSRDYKQAMEYKKQHFPSCTICGPQEKMWTAKVIVPPDEFKMPRREKLNISKHVERMQFARALRNKQLLPYVERFRSSSLLSEASLGPTVEDKAGEDGEEEEEEEQLEDCDEAAPEERSKAEDKSTKRQEIKVNVIFKSDERKKSVTYHPNDLKPLFSTKKMERSIAGFTNRNLLPLAEFPGDLMLMNQDFIARGAHLSDGRKANGQEEERIWKDHMGKPASRRY